MIYFDNAATSKQKPQEVYDALEYYLREIGVSPGRGSYGLGIDASRMLYKSRVTIGEFFGLSHPERVIFTKNSTEAINLFFNGILKSGDHVIISCYEHNAVLRPLQNLKDKGEIDYSVISRDDMEMSPKDIYEKYHRENTRIFASTLVSNLTGRVVFREDVVDYFKKSGTITFLDSSQGAGKIHLDMHGQGIDFLAFTSHKDLMGIPGCGGLCCESDEHIVPLIQGGTGIHGHEYTNPDVFPEGYEAGTLNMPAIWALQAGVKYVEDHFQENCEKVRSLLENLNKELEKIEFIKIYDSEKKRESICCFNVNGMASDQVVAYLDKKDVCVRGGIHCAILAHEAIGTVETGAVRVSMNHFNTQEEIRCFVETIKELG